MFLSCTTKTLRIVNLRAEVALCAKNKKNVRHISQGLCSRSTGSLVYKIFSPKEREYIHHLTARHDLRYTKIFGAKDRPPSDVYGLHESASKANNLRTTRHQRIVWQNQKRVMERHALHHALDGAQIPYGAPTTHSLAVVNVDCQSRLHHDAITKNNLNANQHLVF
jgi:hypothetical protein